MVNVRRILQGQVSAVATFALIGLAVPRAGWAALACGSTIGPNAGLVKMTANVGPCAEPVAALTVTGPGTILDMNGFQVFCNGQVGSFDGILVNGTGATVENGTVANCPYGSGVAVGGSGTTGHVIIGVVSVRNASGFGLSTNSNVLLRSTASNNNFGIYDVGNHNVFKYNTASGNNFDGFSSSGTGSTYVLNEATGNGRHGFSLATNNATLVQNTSTDSSSDGFYLSSGNNNVFMQDTADNSGTVGFELDGNGSVVLLSSATGSVGYGFEAIGNSAVFRGDVAANNGHHGFGIGGNSAVVANSRAIHNTLAGFYLVGNGNTVVSNSAVQNGGDGMYVAGDHAVVQANRADSNGASGLVVSTGSIHTAYSDIIASNVMNHNNASATAGMGGILLDGTNPSTEVVANTALNNGGNDMIDDTPGCSPDLWVANVFQYRNPTCIQRLSGVCAGQPDGTTCDAGTNSVHTFTCLGGTCGQCTIVEGFPLLLRYVDNGNGTITDRSTCLVWEKKDNAGGIHDLNNQYQWSSTGTAMDGDAFTVFLAGLNSSGFAGHGDWRLPTSAGLGTTGQAAEIESLFDGSVAGCGSGPPCVDPSFNANCGVNSSGNPGCTIDGVGGPECSCTVPYLYWSASTDTVYAPAVWTQDFYQSDLEAVDKTVTNIFARAVRGGP
jgi:Protein of unknown function (DUF1566)/Right handed beta helix region